MVQQAIMVLTGTQTGKTVQMHGKQFFNGQIRLTAGTKDDLVLQRRFVERTCEAFEAGSVELAEKQERDRARGIQCAAPASTGQGRATGLEGRVGESAGRVQAPSSVNGSGAVADNRSADGDTGVDAERSGYEHTGLRPEQVAQLRKVLEALDPLNDAHWGAEGWPSVETVSDAMADPNITRNVLRAAAPDFNREYSLELSASLEI